MHLHRYFKSSNQGPNQTHRISAQGKTCNFQALPLPLPPATSKLISREKPFPGIELFVKDGMAALSRQSPSRTEHMVDRTLFIEAMRHVAQSVTVVTTIGENGATGATVSAFSSLSADPPSVLVCLRSDSRIGLAVAGNRVFCVNVLPEGAAALAERFSGRFDVEQPDRFGAIDHVEGPTGPLLSGATAFECTLAKIITHGSHDICIGNVTKVTKRGTSPLAYMDGGFKVVRPQAKLEE